MLTLVNARRTDARYGLLRAMHSDRKRVFVDWLGWDLPHQDGCEVDGFDDEHAEYLIVQDRDGQHAGSARLLPTDRPHVLDTMFAGLCDERPPRGPDVREVTRLCTSPRIAADNRRDVLRGLLTGLVDHALRNGLTGFVTITDIDRLPRLLGAGWTCRPLGLPRWYGRAQICPLYIEIDVRTPAQLMLAGTFRPIRHRELVEPAQ